MSPYTLVGLLSLVTAFYGASAVAEDWSRFRGPNGSGVSTAKKIPLTWDDQSHLQWQIPLAGPGSSSPILVGDRLLLTYYTGYGTPTTNSNPAALVRHLLCVSQKDGSTLWDRTIPAEAGEDRYGGFLRDHGYATSTPVADAENVYVFCGKSGVIAFTHDGKELWKTSVGTGSARNGWGSGSSPVLFGDFVIVNAGAESQALIALNKQTGTQVWKSDAPNLHGSWSTPVLVDVPASGTTPARTELVISAPHEIWGFNPTNGDFQWFAEAVADDTICGSLVARDGIVYAVGGRTASAVAVRAGGKDDVSKTHTVWKAALASYVPSPVLAGDRIFNVNERGIIGCLNAASGDKIFQQRLEDAGGVYASPVFADGHLFVVTRRNGTFVLSGNGNGEVIAQNKFTDDTDFNASPAITEGRLFLRSNQALYCIGE